VYLPDWARLEGQIANPVVRDYPIIFPNNREIIKSLDVFIHVIHKNCLQEYIHISWKKKKKKIQLYSEIFIPTTSSSNHIMILS
jgi:hypothetical protein